MKISEVNLYTLRRSFITHRFDKPAKYKLDGVKIWLEHGLYYSRTGITMITSDGKIIKNLGEKSNETKK